MLLNLILITIIFIILVIVILLAEKNDYLKAQRKFCSLYKDINDCIDYPNACDNCPYRIKM